MSSQQIGNVQELLPNLPDTKLGIAGRVWGSCHSFVCLFFVCPPASPRRRNLRMTQSLHASFAGASPLATEGREDVPSHASLLGIPGASAAKIHVSLRSQSYHNEEIAGFSNLTRDQIASCFLVSSRQLRKLEGLASIVEVAQEQKTTFADERHDEQHEQQAVNGAGRIFFTFFTRFIYAQYCLEGGHTPLFGTVT